MSNLDDLKSEAASLGITHNKSIGEAKLKEKIEAYYVSQETGGPAIKEEVAKNEETGTSSVVSQLDPMTTKRLKIEKDARKTRVVTILDNDQRVNNHTTTCIVSCSNSFFDLGTRVLPLGEKIEVCQGHIGVLKEILIPLHSRDPKTGLATLKSRARYSVSYEDMQ